MIPPKPAVAISAYLVFTLAVTGFLTLGSAPGATPGPSVGAPFSGCSAAPSLTPTPSSCRTARNLYRHPLSDLRGVEAVVGHPLAGLHQ